MPSPSEDLNEPTNEPTTTLPPPPDPPPSAPGAERPRPAGPSTGPLRRDAQDRVVAGVAGGLGRHFGVDPVLFRVLFATTALFGGVGIVAYLLAWALIPEDGAVDPPADRIIAELRRRRIPFWLVVGGGGLLLFLALAHSWRPWGVAPLLVAAAVVAIAISKREPLGPDGLPANPPAAATTPAIDVAGEVPAEPSTTPVGDQAGSAQTTTRSQWVASARAWQSESRAAARVRRHRMAPMRWGAFGALLVGLGAVAALDVTRGVPIASYGWVLLVIGLGALVVGGILRRTPWLNAVWAVLGLAIVLTFAGSPVSLTDGTGDQLLAPHAVAGVPTSVDLAFGRTTLDLTQLPATPVLRRTVVVEQAAGLVVVRIPRGAGVAVDAHVRYGRIFVDGGAAPSGSGFDVSRRVAGGGPTLAGLVVEVRLTAGNIEIDHEG